MKIYHDYLLSAILSKKHFYINYPDESQHFCNTFIYINIYIYIICNTPILFVVECFHYITSLPIAFTWQYLCNPWSQPCSLGSGQKKKEMCTKQISIDEHSTGSWHDTGSDCFRCPRRHPGASISGGSGGGPRRVPVEGGGKRFRAGSMNEKSRGKPVRRYTVWLRSSSLRFLKGDVWVLPLSLPYHSSVI